MRDVPLLYGISEIAGNYDAFILDLWGVVHNGLQPYPGVTACLEKLKNEGKQICLLSNSPNRTEHVSALLEEMGVSRGMYTHLLTSGEMVNTIFRENDGIFSYLTGLDFYDLWPQSFATTMDGLPMHKAYSLEQAGFLLAALLDTENRNDACMYEEELARAVKLGLPMICANPDLKVHHGEHLALCPGTLAVRYEELGGRVHWIGKPFPEVYEHAHGLLDSPDKNRILAVGDSIATDIKGANDFGIDSALNLPGLHRNEVRSDRNPENTDPEKVRALLASREPDPDYVLEGFKW